MINSMTAFARETSAGDGTNLTIELRSVNHRYLECSFKLPDLLRQQEPRLRELIRSKVTRGKLDCLIRVESAENREATIELDTQRLQDLTKASTAVAQQFGNCHSPSTLDILQFPGICKPGNDSEQGVTADCDKAFCAALDILVESRRREGCKLEAVIRERLSLVAQEVAKVRRMLPSLLARQREKLVARINELDITTDPARLEQELVYLAQKADVDEELDRLETHIEEVGRVLNKGGACGRRLDFLMQELNREANTLSSKSIASDTTLASVELKVLIEQMREQIQNIE